MLCWSAVFCKQPLHRPEEGCLVCFELSVLRRILFYCYWKGSSETIQESGAEANYLYKIKQPYDAVLNHLKRHPLFGICCGLCPTYSLSKCALVLRCGIWVWGPAMLWRINPFHFHEYLEQRLAKCAFIIMAVLHLIWAIPAHFCQC